MPSSLTDPLEAVLRARPFQSAEDVFDSILLCLKAHIPFKLWMITRVDDNDWTVVRSLDEGYGTVAGMTFDWSRSYCSSMVRGEGPMFAEDASLIETYRNAAINLDVPLPIRAYIGMPILSQDGRLHGTLCALDPAPQQPLTEKQRMLVLTLTRSLSTLQMVYAEAETARRRAQKFQYQAQTDALTGVYNRRGWELALNDQEMATARTAQNAMIAIIDVDNLKEVNDHAGHAAGDTLLIKAASILQQEIRENDVVARLGGDEFGVMSPELSKNAAGKLAARLTQSLRQAGVPSSVGYAMRLHHRSMNETVQAADRAMYRIKSGA
ncbi:GGDEF domain-containing protein [Orrella marina]|nr:sensor domain-containing diguanylate cyclase [Orrella marina]